MKINIFTILTILFLNLNYSQPYKMKWGHVGVEGGYIKLATINPQSKDLYLIYGLDKFSDIHKFNNSSGQTSIFFSFPRPNPLPDLEDEQLPYVSVIEQIKFDNHNNLIVYGRTHSDNLGTLGVYSSLPLTPAASSGYSFICKINQLGNIVWFTYFHDVSPQKNSLTIDSQNNIYILNQRHKSEILSSTTFQTTGDLNSTKEYQTVISKISPTGNHIWSTFYFNDDSDIYSIEAGSNGIYLYGSYLGNNSTNNFFSTNNSFQSLPGSYTSSTSISKIFLSKFNFNGQRLWSTYYGDFTTSPCFSYLSFYNNLLVINDEAYILTKHNHDITTNISNMSTNGSYINYPIHNFENNTLTKFDTNGNRVWCTYIFYGSGIFKTQDNDLMLIGELNFNESDTSKITSNAHQSSHGGKKDMYISILNKDGKQLKYGSYFGFDGNEIGTLIPIDNGYYIFGNTSDNLFATNGFTTFNEPLSGYISGKYNGWYINFFEDQNLKKYDHKTDAPKLYPNPTNGLIHIDINENNFKINNIIIYNTLGIVVMRISKENKNLSTFDISSLNSGTYLITIECQNINFNYKIIKK